MKQAVLAHWDLPILPIIALIIFMVCFITYTVWTYKKVNKKFYDQASQIPLMEPTKVSSYSKGKGL